MFYVYILKSKKDEEWYVGFTADLRRRFSQYASGLVVSTKARRPFELIYYEAYTSKDKARKREHNIKLRGQAFVQLKRRIS